MPAIKITEIFSMLRNLLMSFALLFSAYTIHAQTCDSGLIMTGTLTNTRAVCTPFASAISPFSGSTPGLVPTSLGGTSNFLRSDGTWVAPSGISYPAAGIPNSTGTAWGTSYTTSGTGSTVALTNGPAFNSATFGSTGQLSIDGSGNFAIGYTGSLPIPWPLTVGTTGQFHCDASGNCRAVTFNGIDLATGGPTTSYLGQDGTYHALAVPSSEFPITLGTTSIAANSTTTSLPGLTSISLTGPTANSGTNYNSGSLAWTGSFNDAGPVNQTWVAINLMGEGLTPTSTLSISPIPGGTTGSRIFQVSADEEILENGAGIVHVTGNSAYMGVSATGVSVGPSDVTISGAASAGNVLLNAGATGLVIASRPVQLPVASFVSGGTQVNFNSPGGGTGVFNQNVTAENGDLQPCPTGTPTVSLGPASGTPGNGATASILGTNCAGMVTIKTGSDTTSQAYIFTVTFSNPFTHYGFCTFAPASNTLQDGGITPDNVYMSTGQANSFSLGLVGTGVMGGLFNHQWSYNCGGY